MSDDLQVTDAVTIPAKDLHWTASRSSGPGGQNVNKVATKVDLRFDLPATEALADAVKERLRGLSGARLDGEGRVVVVCQSTRSQADNLEEARARLATLVRAALRPPRPRRPTAPSRAARERRLADKRRRAALKRERGGGPEEGA